MNTVRVSLSEPPIGKVFQLGATRNENESTKTTTKIYEIIKAWCLLFIQNASVTLL